MSTATVTGGGGSVEYVVTWASASHQETLQKAQRASDIVREAYFQLYCAQRQSVPLAQALREFACAIEDALDVLEGVPA